jgi:hypothetical protein
LGGEWAEVRSTAPGISEWLPASVASPGDGSASYEGVLNLVTEPQTQKVRRLPTLYLGKAPFFGHRNLAAVQEYVGRAAALLVQSSTQPTYLLRACHWRSRPGLYGADFHNRSAFRRKLTSLGMTFGDEPFVQLNDRGNFRSSAWGDISPEFLVMKTSAEDPESVAVVAGALLLTMVSGTRLGALSAAELSRLAAALSSTTGVGSPHPEAVVSFLDKHSQER